MSNFENLESIFEVLDENQSQEINGGWNWLSNGIYNVNGMGKVANIVGGAVEGNTKHYW